ncbi:hypothetical protein GCM10010345_79470 [Streptomyces canarius]|uniref:Uncharacterized protein n=1 Tax=Streptomyces canarius TaxID=285453 RepID=A0ABQ3DAR4_9ACTN|nr:hypothetical protein GCM10010345_79470 [Streptomyces canarius]
MTVTTSSRWARSASWETITPTAGSSTAVSMSADVVMSKVRYGRKLGPIGGCAAGVPGRRRQGRDHTRGAAAEGGHRDDHHHEDPCRVGVRQARTGRDERESHQERDGQAHRHGEPVGPRPRQGWS